MDHRAEVLKFCSIKPTNKEEVLQGKGREEQGRQALNYCANTVWMHCNSTVKS